MSHLKIDGHELEINELYSWVAGFLILYRQGRLRKVRLPQEIRGILEECGEVEPGGPDRQTCFGETFRKIRRGIGHRIDAEIKKLERRAEGSEGGEKTPKEKTAEEDVAAGETAIRLLVEENEKEEEILRGTRRHSTVYLYRKEFEKYKGRKPAANRLDRLPVNEKEEPAAEVPAREAGFLAAAALDFMKKVSARLRGGDENDGTSLPEGAAPPEKPAWIRKYLMEKQRGDRTLSDGIIRWLMEHDDYMDSFVNVVRHGITELAIDKFNG